MNTRWCHLGLTALPASNCITIPLSYVNNSTGHDTAGFFVVVNSSCLGRSLNWVGGGGFSQQGENWSELHRQGLVG